MVGTGEVRGEKGEENDIGQCLLVILTHGFTTVYLNLVLTCFVMNAVLCDVQDKRAAPTKLYISWWSKIQTIY